MRKVYHIEQSRVGVAAAIILSVGLTAILFGILPFAHQLAKPERRLELRTLSTTELPPATESEAPPPVPEPEPPVETPAEPQLVEAPPPIAITADLDIASGSGGALAGFGEAQAQTAVESLAEKAFEVTELERRPEPVSQVPPIYPEALRRAKVEGHVTLIFVLNAEGLVEDPRVETSTHPEFEAPALEAIRKWRFKPGYKDGQPVRTYLRQTIRFRMPDSARS